MKKKAGKITKFVALAVIVALGEAYPVTIHGRITFKDYHQKATGTTPVRHARVEIWEEDPGFGSANDNRQAVVFTDSDGRFKRANIPLDDDPFPGTKTSDIYIRVWAQPARKPAGGWFQVQNDISLEIAVIGGAAIAIDFPVDNDWDIRSTTIENIGGDTEINIAIGNEGVESDVNKAFTIHQRMLESRDFLHKDGHYGFLKDLDVFYPEAGDASYFFDVGGPYISLRAADIQNPLSDHTPSVAWHEYGHFAQYYLRDYNLIPYASGEHFLTQPIEDSPAPRSASIAGLIFEVVSARKGRNTAYGEGFADFFAVATADAFLSAVNYKGHYYRAGRTAGLNIETLDRNLAKCTNIDNMEARVAGFLYDIYDPATLTEIDDVDGGHVNKPIFRVIFDHDGIHTCESFIGAFIRDYYPNERNRVLEIAKGNGVWPYPIASGNRVAFRVPVSNRWERKGVSAFRRAAIQRASAVAAARK